MSDATTVTALLNSITHGPAWHGPSTMEAIEGVSAEDAASHPVDGVHSIWEIVNHVNAWQAYSLAVLAGEDAGLLDGQDDWPPLPLSHGETEWHAVCRDLERLGREICETVLQCDDRRMKETVPGKDFTLKVLLHGVVSHNVYHGGQIALLKKCLENESKTEAKAVGD